jgi:hypothetical protein
MPTLTLNFPIANSVSSYDGAAKVIINARPHRVHGDAQSDAARNKRGQVVRVAIVGIHVFDFARPIWHEQILRPPPTVQPEWNRLSANVTPKPVADTWLSAHAYGAHGAVANSACLA